MEMFPELRISASGLMAERKRMELISDNIANSSSPQLAGGQLYQAKRLVTAPASEFKGYLAGFRQSAGNGVEIVGVATENTNPRLAYEPGNPNADEKGYVAYPDINVIDEMVESISAMRTYEANVTAFNETKRMLNRVMEIGK